MKIKIDSILMSQYGEPLKSQRKGVPSKGGNGSPELEDLTLRHVIVNSLLENFPDEKSLSGEDKLKRYQLAMKVQAAKTEVDLETGEIVLIKDLVGKGWAPIVSGQAWTMIEP